MILQALKAIFLIALGLFMLYKFYAEHWDGRRRSARTTQPSHTKIAPDLRLKQRQSPLMTASLSPL